MKKTIFLLVLSIGIISCEKDNVIIEEENRVEEVAEELEEFQDQDESLLKSQTTFTDESGKIEFVIVGVQKSNSQLVNGQVQRNLELTVDVPDGYVCIGGAVNVPMNDLNAGSLVTMSAPTVGTDAFKGWRGAAKEHAIENRFVWRIIVKAIGIRVKDDNGNYIPANELKNSLKLITKTSSLAAHPSTSAILPSGYKLISGGAKVNWSGFGNLLTESYPLGNSWKVKSKDHLVSSPATITAYAIGVKNTIPNFGSFSIINRSSCSPVSSGYGYEGRAVESGYRISGVGAKVTYNGPHGRMICSTDVSSISMGINSKDHGRFDSGNTCAYYVGIKKAQ